MGELHAAFVLTDLACADIVQVNTDEALVSVVENIKSNEKGPCCRTDGGTDGPRLLWL